MHHNELGIGDFKIDSPSSVTEDLEQDIDASTTTLLANITKRGNSDDNFLSDDYSLITPEEKEV